jgi:hypothetical protein
MHQSVYPLATLSNTFRPINNIEKNIYEKTKSTNPYIYLQYSQTLSRPIKNYNKKEKKKEAQVHRKAQNEMNNNKKHEPH